MQNIFNNIELSIEIRSLLSPILLLLFAPLFNGIVNKFRAKIEGRSGPKILQPYFDLKKLLTKEVIVPEASSWIFSIFPYLTLIISVCITVLIPVFFTDSLFWYYSDLIFIAGLFLLVAFFMVLSSFDAGTSFVGMGSSREAFLISLSEPVIMLIIFALSMEFDTSNLFNFVKRNSNWNEWVAHPGSIFIAIAFLMVIVTECKRFPVDNPSTHLELTMVHEALLLEYSGKYLSMLEYASMLKFTIFVSLFFTLFMPWGISNDATLFGFIISLLAWSFKMVLFAFFIALYEKSTAKLRLFKVPQLLSFAMVLTLISIFAHYYIQLW